MTSRDNIEPETPFLDLDPNSYTASRLLHASPSHINLTTRRCFIGPIPEGWLKSHRKSWYKQYFHLADYSSRAATFSANAGSFSHQRRITGLDGPSTSAAFGTSFPQPTGLDDDDDDDDNDVNEGVDGAEETVPDLEDGDGKDAETAVMGEIEATATTTGLDNGSKGGEDRQESPEGSRSQRNEPQDTVESSPKNRRLSFVTAPMTPKKPFKSRLTALDSAKSPPETSSFVTASESPARFETPSKSAKESKRQTSLDVPQTAPDTPSSPSPGNGTSSMTALLPKKSSTAGSSPDIKAKDLSKQTTASSTPGLVRFNVNDKPVESNVQTVAKVSQAGRRRSWRRFRHGQKHPGEIIKMEKMLIRVEVTRQELPPDYDENDSIKTETRIVENWREFVVVCRESTNNEAEFSIQMYKSRVIPATEETHVSKRSTHEFPLNLKTTHVNMFSSLDKTLVIWVPWKMGTMIYVLRTKSSASAVEWYTFIRDSLGWKRSSDLQVNVPDLSVTLQLENPFSELEASMNAAQASRADDATITKTMEAEKAVANTIIQRSLKMLENNPEWADVLEAWLAKEKIGLAWKRYDRLEWVHGANEQRMYGTLAMQRTHELELRPKNHYPTDTRIQSDTLVEPAPVEGFLIRLTSQKGNVRRLGKMYFKRLYFTTHNNYLCYCRPAKALPPPPPKLSAFDGSKIPGASEILDKTPLIYAVNPYPDKDGEIEWLQEGGHASRARHDQEAYKEEERKTNTMLQAEGYINLSHVIRVQNAHRGNSPADANVDEGPDVDFHEEVEDTTQDDGKTNQFDDKRTFELVMKNKLVIRLQAYNEETKKEWIHRLRKLVHYWKLRLADDMQLLKMVRGQNLKRLEIDEEQEAHLGQYGEKWEVTRSVASPKLFNMCSISCCRAITMSGVLYRKPKRHATFLRSDVVLCHGTLLIFHSTLRKRTGQPVRHIQHDRQSSLDLKNCYIYSGLLTEGDLLYQNQTFDSNHPGHHALPKVYREDGWTSTDEDAMTTFVIWQPRNKSWFKASEGGDGKGKGKTRSRLRYVSRLGVSGRSVVFKARSRAERDHWVLSIGMEIDRLQGGEEVRVVEKK